MTADEKRRAVVRQYQKILGRNRYDSSPARRDCAFAPCPDGNYYSDCSSSMYHAYRTAKIGLRGIGGNTISQYRNPRGRTVDCDIVGGVPRDIGRLRLGDLFFFAGDDARRAHADFVGHVEMVYAIRGEEVVLCGHGSTVPKTHSMRAYCRARQSVPADTAKGDCGLLKVVRFIPE